MHDCHLLQKYSSLPELQLQRRLYQCRQCIHPTRTWTCKHEFKNSTTNTTTTRVRRISAPPRVFIRIDLSSSSATLALLASDHANIHSNPSNAQMEINTKSCFIDPIPIVPSSPTHQIDPCIQSHRDHIYDNNMLHDYCVGIISSEGFDAGVTTTTRSTQAVTVEQVQYDLEDTNSTIEPNMAPRRAFNLRRTDKMPAFHLDGDNAHNDTKNVLLTPHELTTSPTKSAFSHPTNPRTLRRKNHLHVMPFAPDLDAPEPIAISLTLHPPTSSHLNKKPSPKLTDYITPSHPHTRAHSHSHSVTASDSSDIGVTPPMTPTHPRSPPSSVPPKNAVRIGSSSAESSPVRLGHPSRPYYTAIRKNGISPTPSRSRPQSQPPPSSFNSGSDLTPAVAPPVSTTMTNASRHLSMSVMPPSPPAFSALHDARDNINGNNKDFEVHSGPTNSARLSLSSSIQSHAHHAQSISRATKGSVTHPSSSIGFSMSGETELRMALAASSPSGSATLGRSTRDGFRFRETVIPSETNNRPPNDDVLQTRKGASRDGFMGRVKKLRKGLEKIFMN